MRGEIFSKGGGWKNRKVSLIKELNGYKRNNEGGPSSIKRIQSRGKKMYCFGMARNIEQAQKYESVNRRGCGESEGKRETKLKKKMYTIDKEVGNTEYKEMKTKYCWDIKKRIKKCEKKNAKKEFKKIIMCGKGNIHG